MFSSTKRKRYDESDEDEPALGRQILPVANLPESFSGVPLDGMQYLFTVRRDARKLPSITRVANPYEVPETIKKPVASTSKDVGLPSSEWRHTFLNRFKNFRMNSLQPTIGVGPLTSVANAKLMPDKKNRDGWFAFITGEPDNVWNKPFGQSKKMKQKKFRDHAPNVSAWQDQEIQSENTVSRPAPHIYGDDDEVAEADPIIPVEASPFSAPAARASQKTAAEVGESTSQPLRGSPSPPIKTELIPREPKPALLRSIDNRYCLHLLMYFDHWLSLVVSQPVPVSLPPQSYSRWMFSLLSCIETNISANDMSQLRSLARNCIHIIKHIRASVGTVEEEAERRADLMSETACWMLVTVIAGFWGQSDLWTDAEAILSSS